MTVPTATHVRAADLKVGDSFDFMGSMVTTTKVTPLENSGLVEVEVFDTFLEVTRWLDHAAGEIVQVVSGPSTVAVAPEPVAPVKTATQRARDAVRKGLVRSLPASASLVLYALAAAQDEADDSVFVPTLASIAVGAGLAQSTTQGHLRSLAAKGLVRSSNGLGWEVS